MSSKTSQDLYTALFDVLEGIKAGTVTVDQAKACIGVSQVMVNLARVECDFSKVSDQAESKFLAQGDQAKLGNGIVGITRHQLK